MKGITQTGKESYTTFQYHGQNFYRYYYQMDDGSVFCQTCKTLKECREKRDKWINQKTTKA